MNKFYFILFLLFLFPIVSGFGVTPAQRVSEYQPGTEQRFSFDIINSEKKNLNLVLIPQGELNSSIGLSTFSVKLASDTPSTTIEYTVKVPSGLLPGKHNAEVMILEIPDASASGNTYIGALVGIVTKVVIDVPYPGKYAESSLSISSGDNSVSFVIPVVSKGKLDIARAKAVIDIHTPLNEKVASLTTQEIPILSGQRVELAAKWDISSVAPGRYKAYATVLYDESTINLEKEFSAGKESLVIKNVEVNDFSLGEIAKFEFLIENKLNSPADDVYIMMQVFNDKKEVMAEFKSASYDIQQFNSQLMVAFWDTEGVKAGNYDARAFINFGQSSIQKDLTLDVSEDDITVVGLGYVIKSSGQKGGGSLVTVLSIAVGVLILLNLTWFLVLRKKIKK